jgi:Stress responsive A/B Barrel Domain
MIAGNWKQAFIQQFDANSLYPIKEARPMRKLVAALIVVALIVGAAVIQSYSHAGGKTPDNIGHMVYFKLKDGSAKATADLVASCDKYLSGHDGTIYYSAGTLAQDLKRDVNDRDFDVALHLVFKDRPSYDKYADHPRHEEFIKLGKDNWSKVRVFDAYVKAK